MSVPDALAKVRPTSRISWPNRPPNADRLASETKPEDPIPLLLLLHCTILLHVAAYPGINTMQNPSLAFHKQWAIGTFESP